MEELEEGLKSLNRMETLQEDQQSQQTWTSGSSKILTLQLRNTQGEMRPLAHT